MDRMPHMGVIEEGLIMKLTNFLLHAQKENNVSIHPCIPPTNSKEKKCPKSVVLVHKVCCLKYKI
jgi:hypothetical protein